MIAARRAGSIRPGRQPGPLSFQAEAIVFGIVVIAVLALAALPLSRLVATALWPKGAFDLAPFLAEISGRGVARATWNSLTTSIIGALGAVMIGVPAALVVALGNARAARVFSFLFVLSTMMAPQVIAIAFLTLLGPASPLIGLFGLAPPRGWSEALTGAAGVMALLAIHHAPLVFITVRAGLRQVPRDLVEAARVAGDRPLLVTWRVILPLIRPSILAGAALAFVACLGNFGIPALLGLPANYMTLPTLIYMTLTSSGPSVLAEVAALSLIITGLAILGLVVAGFVATGPRTRLAPFEPAERVFSFGRWRIAVDAALWVLLLVVLIIPLASLFATALVPTYGVPLTAATVTLDNFVEVLARQDVTARAFVNSAVYAGTAAAILAVVSIPFAHGLARRDARLARGIEGLIELPFALPGVVLALAMILLFLRPLPILGISLYATPAIIIIAYLARFAALAVKAPMVAISQMPAELEEAARISGAGYGRRLRTIVAPLAAPAAVAGAVLVFLTAFNELTVSALLWSAGTETLGVVLFNLEDGGYGVLAAAVGVTATGVITLAMLALDLAGRGLPRGVIPWR